MESAKIDGSNWLTTIVKITIPMIEELAFVLIADTTINLLMFALMQILTSGGPRQVPMYSRMRRITVFIYADKGRGDVIVAVLLFIIAVVALQFCLLT